MASAFNRQLVPVGVLMALMGSFLGTFLGLAAALRGIGFDGYAIGGLSVGEPKEEMIRVLDFLPPHLPAWRTRAERFDEFGFASPVRFFRMATYFAFASAASFFAAAMKS